MRRLASLRTTTSAVDAPSMRAQSAAPMPIMPVPTTHADCPAARRLRFTACRATASGSSMAATVGETPSGSGRRFHTGTATSSAKPPSRRDPT